MAVLIVTVPMHVSVESLVGEFAMMNVNGLPDNAPFVPLASRSVTWKVLVTVLGAVMENLKVTPPFAVVSAGFPVPPVVKVGVEKSTESATAFPSASFTVTVQEMASLIRA